MVPRQETAFRRCKQRQTSVVIFSRRWAGFPIPLLAPPTRFFLLPMPTFGRSRPSQMAVGSQAPLGRRACSARLLTNDVCNPFRLAVHTFFSEVGRLRQRLLLGLSGAPSTPRLSAARKTGQDGPWEGGQEPTLSEFGQRSEERGGGRRGIEEG